LESYVSLKLALQTKHWAKVNEDVYVKINENDLYKYFLHGSYSSQHETSRISVDFNDCLDYFNEVEFQIAEAEKQFSHVQICKIQYEDLVLNQEKELNKIFKYLGLENEVLVNTVQKQNNRSYREIIINYDELKNYFINTKWSTFFKE
jgi:hypothetical protein